MKGDCRIFQSLVRTSSFLERKADIDDNIPVAASSSIQMDLGAQTLLLGHLNMRQPMGNKIMMCHQNDSVYSYSLKANDRKPRVTGSSRLISTLPIQ